jgi:hypothetical protein
MKKRDNDIDLSVLIMAFIGFYPPAPSVYECARSLLLRRRGHKRVQGVSKAYYLLAAGGRAMQGKVSWSGTYRERT